MYAVIQNGYGLFGTGKTEAEATENALLWTVECDADLSEWLDVENGLRLGSKEGEFTIVPMLRWDEYSEIELDSVREIVSNDGFDYDHESGLFYSLHGDTEVWQDFCDGDGKSLCYLIHV